MFSINKLFCKYEELEAFMVLANELQKEINNIIFLNQRKLSEQNLNSSINYERKNLFQLLMNVKDINELNTHKVCLVSLCILLIFFYMVIFFYRTFFLNLFSMLIFFTRSILH